jgi:hypothetical protein
VGKEIMIREQAFFRRLQANGASGKLVDHISKSG